MTPWEYEKLRAFAGKNLARGLIQPAKSQMAAPVLLQEKKDCSLRLCIDYRGLNVICLENVYTLLLMKDILGHLAKGPLELREAYYRVPIKKGDEWKMAFNCLLGCFQFQVHPFGLQGLPAVFM